MDLIVVFLIQKQVSIGDIYKLTSSSTTCDVTFSSFHSSTIVLEARAHVACLKASDRSIQWTIDNHQFGLIEDNLLVIIVVVRVLRMGPG